VVCLSVYLSVPIVRPAKTAEPIEMLFVNVNANEQFLSPRESCNTVTTAAPDDNIVNNNFGMIWDVDSSGPKEATWRIRLSRLCAAAMRPFCQITLTTCDI